MNNESSLNSSLNTEYDCGLGFFSHISKCVILCTGFTGSIDKEILEL